MILDEQPRLSGTSTGAPRRLGRWRILEAGIFCAFLSFGLPLSAQQTAAAPDKVFCIGTYNMAMFGPSKLKRSHTLEALARVGASFDIMAMQEVGSNGSTAAEGTCIKVMEGYTAAVNKEAGGCLYGYVRGNQYGYIYRQDKFEIKTYGLYSGSAHFTYTPFFAYFRLRNSDFDFIMLTIHTRPSLAAREVPELAAAMDDLSAQYHEAEIVCLGDFNADGGYYNEQPLNTLSSDGTADGGGNSVSAAVSGSSAEPEWSEEGSVTAGSGVSASWLSGFPPERFISVVPNEADTTVAGGTECAYDRIELSRGMAAHYSGFWGVLEPGELWDLSACEAPGNAAGTDRALSDHYPVWGLFYSETGPLGEDTN